MGGVTESLLKPLKGHEVVKIFGVSEYEMTISWRGQGKIRRLQLKNEMTKSLNIPIVSLF